MGGGVGGGDDLSESENAAGKELVQVERYWILTHSSSLNTTLMAGLGPSKPSPIGWPRTFILVAFLQHSHCLWLFWERRLDHQHHQF